MQLEGRVALITGGSAGIGAAIAERFVAEGARVCISGRRKAMLDSVAGSLPAGSVVTCVGDVTKAEDIQAMVDTTLAFGGKLDILVNNAGIDPGGSITEIEPELWRKIIETNLTAPFLVMRAAIPHMIECGGGSVINVASLGGLRCLPGMPAYCSSKAGLIMLTQQAALDYGAKGVRCNVVCPGLTRTAMTEHSLGPVAEALGTDIDGVMGVMISNVPLHRVGTPEETAKVCVFLASDDSSFMTGGVLVVDGGTAIVDACGASLTGSGVKWGAGER